MKTWNLEQIISTIENNENEIILLYQRSGCVFWDNIFVSFSFIFSFILDTFHINFNPVGKEFSEIPVNHKFFIYNIPFLFRFHIGKVFIL